MASTTEHISIRLPKELVAQLRETAKSIDRSLNWVIVKKLSDLPIETKQSIEKDSRQFARMIATLKVPEPEPEPEIERPLAKIERGPNGENLREMYRAGVQDLGLGLTRAVLHSPTCKCLICKPPKSTSNSN